MTAQPYAPQQQHYPQQQQYAPPAPQYAPPAPPAGAQTPWGQQMGGGKGIDLGGGGNAFTFDAIGASVTGRILSLTERQQTDMETGMPATWQDGSPKTMYVVELGTGLRADAYDDGVRSVYLRGSKKPESASSLAAVIGAVRAATGGTQILPGGTLTLTYVGDGEASRRGYSPPKRYEARYAPPSVQLDPGPAAPPAWVPPGPQQVPQAPQYGPPPAAEAPVQYVQQAPQAPQAPQALQVPQAPAAPQYTAEQIAAAAAAGISLPGM